VLWLLKCSLITFLKKKMVRHGNNQIYQVAYEITRELRPMNEHNFPNKHSVQTEKRKVCRTSIACRHLLYASLFPEFNFCLQIKMEGLPSHKQMFLFISSQHVSDQTGHHQVMVEEYTNSDGIFINNNASVKFLLVKIGSDST
jgi:hypothetical protein